MRISDWSSDVCSSDLWSTLVDRDLRDHGQQVEVVRQGLLDERLRLAFAPAEIPGLLDPGVGFGRAIEDGGVELAALGLVEVDRADDGVAEAHAGLVDGTVCPLRRAARDRELRAQGQAGGHGAQDNLKRLGREEI